MIWGLMVPQSPKWLISNNLCKGLSQKVGVFQPRFQDIFMFIDSLGYEVGLFLIFEPILRAGFSDKMLTPSN